MTRTITPFAAALAFAVALGFGVAQAEDTEKPAEEETKMVELKLELPKPMIEGTPKNMPGVRLDPDRPKLGKRPPFKVPEGTVLLSKEKPVTGDEDAIIIGEFEMVTDGDKDAGLSFIEFFPGITWVQVDLEKAADLHAIVVWHYHKDVRVYRDVVVQVSNDPKFKDGVTTVYNNDHDNSSELGEGKDFEYIETFEGQIMPVKAVNARYVRLYTNGNTADESNHMIEVEVYGTPAKDEDAE